MLKVTDSAAALIGEILEVNRVNEFDVFRLSRAGEDLGLAIDREREGDHVVPSGDRNVLVMEPEIAEAFGDTTLDAVDTEGGQELALLPVEEK